MKGIWIPKELIDLDISWIKKALLCEISQLEELDRGCVASNSHFAEKFNITSQGVSKALNELERDGYIVIDNSQSKRNFGRTITINFSKSAINFSKSAINFSVESKEKKPVNKTINKDSILNQFIKENNTNESTIEWAEWFVKYRKSIKKNVKTVKQIELFIKSVIECMKDGYSKQDIRDTMESRAWQTVKLEWLANTITSSKDW